MKNVYDITDEFEKRLSEYTGAPYVVTVDNQSNALFLALMYENICGQEITIPSRTYPSVPCEIIHAGGKVNFKPVKGKTLTGAYLLTFGIQHCVLHQKCTNQEHTCVFHLQAPINILNYQKVELF